MNLTVAVILFSAIALIIYDIVIIMIKGKHESISAHIIRAQQNPKYRFVFYAFFFLLGHLFWSMITEDVYKDVKCESTNYKEVER